MNDSRLTNFALITSGFLAALFFALSGYTLYGARWFNRQVETADVVLSAPLPVGRETGAIRISTFERGIVAVQERSVEALNLAFTSFSADSLSLTHEGEPIAFYIDTANPNNEILYFYAEGATDELAPAPVYNLTLGIGTTMQEWDAQPTAPGVIVAMRTKRWEENLRFFPQASGARWLGKQIFAPSSQTFELDGISPTGAGEAQLTLELWSSSESEANPDHHIDVQLNNAPLIEKYWDGIIDVTTERQMDASMLKSSDNQLSITALGDANGGGESIYVNSIELAYESYLTLGNQQLAFESSADNLMIGAASDAALLFDVSDVRAPKRLVNLRADEDGVSFAGAELGARFIALKPSAAIGPQLTAIPVWDEVLKTPVQEADYIAIVPAVAQFEEALAPLLAHREQQGLTVKLVPLEQIYDEFSFGHPTPEAIQQFLAYATESWSRAPRFVLLVGDASYDLHNFTESDHENLVPAHLNLDSADSLIADDGWLTEQADGTLNPELAIGRFPVQNRLQLATLVRKTLAYENRQSSDNNDWKSRMLLVADDQAAFSEATLTLTTAVQEGGFRPLHFDMLRNERIHDSLISAINQGVGLVNYIGEGDLEAWGDERVLRASDSAELINGNRLPILTTFTTRNGYFNHPQISTLAERLLWADNGGIVAAIAPSGRAPMAHQIAFGDAFYQQFLESGRTQTLGEMLQQARIENINNQATATLNLLGDPALRVYLPSEP